MGRLKIYLFAFLIGFALACNNKPAPGNGPENEVAKKYTCPMHPEIIRDKPGQCPICGMDLVEIKETGEKVSDKQLELLLKPTNEYVLSKIKTIRLSHQEMPLEFELTGRITYDTRLINTVASRVSGRIEKLHVKYRYQPVKKGEKLMDIYSKDLLTEQENLLYLLKNDSENQDLIAAATKKLKLMGLSEEQLAHLKKTGKSSAVITIYSPYSGHIHELVTQTETSGMNGNESMQQELLVREGMYVEKVQAVFNIYNTEKVWCILNFYPGDENFMKKGDKVRLKIDGVTEEITATLDLIEPMLRPGQKTSSARVYLDNTDGLIKIGSNATGYVERKAQGGNFIPETAVLHLGANQVAFVKSGDAFISRRIETGSRYGGWTQVLAGLDSTDVIAENAQLLMDSETFVHAGQVKK